jgi:hypothetical protein
LSCGYYCFGRCGDEEPTADDINYNRITWLSIATATDHQHNYVGTGTPSIDAISPFIHVPTIDYLLTKTMTNRRIPCWSP